MPLYVANFVLMEYKEGAIFGCPAHDQRDFEFAQEYDLPIIPVISSAHLGIIPACDQGSYTESQYRATRMAGGLNEEYASNNIIFNSEFLNGLTVSEAREVIVKKLEEKE